MEETETEDGREIGLHGIFDDSELPNILEALTSQKTGRLPLIMLYPLAIDLE